MKHLHTFQTFLEMKVLVFIQALVTFPELVLVLNF